MLYLCFLEMARQVSGQCKEQGLMLIKLWHSYFDHFQVKMKTTLAETAQHTQKINALLEDMTHKFAKVLTIDESKDIEFLELIDKHQKSLELIELLSKSLYEERQETTRLKN